MTGADADDDDHVEIVTFTIEEAVRRRAPREAPRASVALRFGVGFVAVAFSQKNRLNDLAPSPSSLSRASPSPPHFSISFSNSRAVEFENSYPPIPPPQYVYAIPPTPKDPRSDGAFCLTK